ncbi:MAG TPA: 4-alpha-glucanotransferase [Opitutaceae bacterium]|nr:4-alpha-glucanotransferase [Opitutaceae bacterium]
MTTPLPAAPPLFNWLTTRGAGVLLHPTSLPGDFGIGTFDEHLDRFLEFLEAAGFKYWQLCPLGPTGYGDSPYQCFSAFAGNPYLIDLVELTRFGLLPQDALGPLVFLNADRVDYGALYRLVWPLFRRAHENFRASRGTLPYGVYESFREANAAWLEPYALFRALKDHYEGRPWWEWPAEARSWAKARKSKLRGQLDAAVEGHAFSQYLFFGQWRRVRAVAAKRGVGIVGDLPIFVAMDSADVWSAPERFELDERTGRPLAVAGVPPDYFSADGQLWGNPLYRWDVHAADDYAWWRERLRAAFELYDVVRIDHFRGFADYWRVPVPAADARQGEWRSGPGLAFFDAARRALPGAKIIAEDLGELSGAARQLRRDTGLPGMAVLQFAFGGRSSNLYLPHNLEGNGVIYPGTHDNDTTLGWYAATGEPTRDHVRRYLRVSGTEIGWDFIRAAYAAVSRLAVIPLQDLLSLGSEGRFNTPGKADGNWQWRYRSAQLDRLSGRTAGYLRELANLHGRLPPPGADEKPV